ncbi:hypothetical protein RCZ01_14930 [Capnocytophaga felis]|uniref:Uncharacterized protein n=1 Tax=Capnocytophaga felis TaxID=2267611 RepID=A0A5M4B9A2_9FLAO|nr:hypothetical protein RCZ01_14930 [Capnocytophaga felis]GET48982.1 hypothetical protein RCZ02_18130 [Capnocytophaga felis]
MGICLFTSEKFELDLGDGITKLRKYDIEMLSGSKLEFKDWSTWANWSNSSFRKQFIPDLADVNFTELGQKKYIFKANKNIDATTLKENVIKALKKADGTPIEEVDKLFGEEDIFSKKVSKLFGVDIDNAKDLIQALDDEKIFNQIFEIVE